MKNETQTVQNNEAQTIEKAIQLLRDLIFDSESLHSTTRREMFDALQALKKVKKYL